MNTKSDLLYPTFQLNSTPTSEDTTNVISCHERPKEKTNEPVTNRCETQATEKNRTKVEKVKMESITIPETTQEHSIPVTANKYEKEETTEENTEDSDKTENVTSLLCFMTKLYDKSSNVFCPVESKQGLMFTKHKMNAPYHIFYTTIKHLPATHKEFNSITFQELLDYSLGTLDNVLHLTEVLDLKWLLWNYIKAGYRHLNMTLVTGRELQPYYKEYKKRFPKMTAHVIYDEEKGHFSKMGLLCYKDGSLRIYLTSANLDADHWTRVTNTVWLSDKCPQLPEGASEESGESATGFKKDLIVYLESYQIDMSVYINRVKRCDFSNVNVFLICSVPGQHSGSKWGLAKLSDTLTKYCSIKQDDGSDWELIAHVCALGLQGVNPKGFLKNGLMRSLCASKHVDERKPMDDIDVAIKIVYPPVEYFCQNTVNLGACFCFDYSDKIHEKQQWICDYLYQWKAEGSGRSAAVSCCTSYARVSRDGRAAFFLLTSANLQASSWGSQNIKGISLPPGHMGMASFEAGVLFLPHFVINKDYFQVDPSIKNRLPLIFDLPLVAYEEGMNVLTNNRIKEMYEKERSTKEGVNQENIAQ